MPRATSCSRGRDCRRGRSCGRSARRCTPTTTAGPSRRGRSRRHPARCRSPATRAAASRCTRLGGSRCTRTAIGSFVLGLSDDAGVTQIEIAVRDANAAAVATGRNDAPDLRSNGPRRAHGSLPILRQAEGSISFASRWRFDRARRFRSPASPFCAAEAAAELDAMAAEGGGPSAPASSVRRSCIRRTCDRATGE